MAVQNSGCVPLADAVLTGQLAFANAAERESALHFFDACIGEFGEGVSLSPKCCLGVYLGAMSSLLHHVDGVEVGVTREQVIRTDARPVVTSVADIDIFTIARCRSASRPDSHVGAGCHLVRPSVSEPLDFPDADQAIPLGIGPSGPDPARSEVRSDDRSILVDFCPEPITAVRQQRAFPRTVLSATSIDLGAGSPESGEAHQAHQLTLSPLRVVGAKTTTEAPLAFFNETDQRGECGTAPFTGARGGTLRGHRTDLRCHPRVASNNAGAYCVNYTSFHHRDMAEKARQQRAGLPTYRTIGQEAVI